jgi:hypothetical protein
MPGDKLGAAWCWSLLREVGPVLVPEPLRDFGVGCAHVSQQFAGGLFRARGNKPGVRLGGISKFFLDAWITENHAEHRLCQIVPLACALPEPV